MGQIIPPPLLLTLTTTNLQPLYDVFAAYATPPILPADAPAAAAVVAAAGEAEGQGIAPRTAGTLHLSPQAWGSPAFLGDYSTTILTHRTTRVLYFGVLLLPIVPRTNHYLLHESP